MLPGRSRGFAATGQPDLTGTPSQLLAIRKPENVMQGFDRFAEFNRAMSNSRATAAAQWNPFLPQIQDFDFAEGLLLALVLVLPFWISLGYAISLLAR